jgi:hypothetical protein
MECQMVQQLMNDEMGDMEGNGRDLTEILSWNLHRGTEQNPKNLRLSGVQTEIWTKHPTNTQLEWYQHQPAR